MVSFVQLLCFNNICLAQNLDSLKRIVVNTTNDTTRLSTLLLLCEQCSGEDILKYADPALKLAERNLKKFENSTLLYKFYLTGMADALTDMGYYYDQYSNSAQALKFHEKALTLYERLNDNRKLANTLIGIGNAQLNLKDDNLARDYYQKALILCEKTKDSIILAPLLNNFGTVYCNQGQLASALDYKNRSLKIYAGMGDKAGIARQLASISNVYQKQGDSEKAQQYNFEALKIQEQLVPKNQFEIANTLHNIAHVYVSSGNPEKAEPYFIKSLAISEKLNNKYGIAYCFTGLAKIYLKNGQKEKALDYLLKGLKINEEIGNRMSMCVSLHYLGEFYLKSGNLSKAFDYAAKSMSIARELENPEKIFGCARLMYKIYKRQKRPALALEMYELYVTQRDSFNNREARNAAIRLQLQHEFDKKEATLKAEQYKAFTRLEKERVEIEARSERRKLGIIIGFIGTGLVVCILLFILFRNKSVRRQKQIEFEKNLLEFEQQVLRAQMNPHFIFNAINSIQKYILTREKQEAYDYLAKFSRLIRIALNNSQEKDLSLQQELEMIKLYVELEQLRFNNFEFNLKIDSDVNEFAITVPAMLIQPYVENAIWHGLMHLENKRLGILNLCVARYSDTLKIVVEDNGIGREQARQYKKEDGHQSYSMALNEQRLLIINKMQQYENAKVIITDVLDAGNLIVGTRVEIFIPNHGK